MWRLAEIYRHPVKSLGEEALDAVALETGRPLPFDRTWAIAHGKTEWSPDNPVWGVPGNFINQTHVPRLAQIKTGYDEAGRRLRLAHPDREPLTIDPDDPSHHAELTGWVAPLTEGTTRTGPFSVCRAPGVAFTDFEDTHVSIASVTSRAALEGMVGAPLEPIRFRMNLWLDGMAPWEEFDLVGREVEIGTVRLKVIGRCERCNATTANPGTGQRDIQVPATLHKHFGHRDFGIYAQVLEGGTIRPGDPARVL